MELLHYTLSPRRGAKDCWARQVCFLLQRTAGSESTARKSPHTHFETTQTLRRSTYRMEFQQGRRRGLRYLPWTTEVPSGPQGQSWAVLVGLGEVWRLQIPPCSHPSIKTPLHNPGLERQGKTVLASFLSLSLPFQILNYSDCYKSPSYIWVFSRLQWGDSRKRPMGIHVPDPHQALPTRPGRVSRSPGL